VILGVLLSSLHQSSLGSLFLIVPHKLHPLWYSSRLPYLFFVSAMSVGFAMVIVESYLSSRAFGKELERPIITDLGRAMMVSLIFLAVLRAQDLIGRGSLPYMFQSTVEAGMFWLEIGLGIILPVLLVAIPKVRMHPQGMFYAALSAVMGLILNRMNVAITGMAGKLGSYFPSWEELSISIMLVSLGLAAFAWAVKNLPVFGTSPWTETVVITPVPEIEPAAGHGALQPVRI
jgi:Ni/Fe-hydrogenase subunit HybB-like protein